VRHVLAVLLLAALLAGCLKDTPAPAPAAPSPTPTAPPGVLGAGNASTLPAAFQAGFTATTVATGYQGGEPNIGVTSSGNVYVTAFQNVVKSADGGRTWAQVSDPTAPPTTLDPMLWVDPITDRIFSNQLYVGCSYLSFSDDEGATWTPSPVSCGTPGIDHQKIATGPYPAAAPQAALAAAAYPNIASYCYNKLMATNCAVSLDGGLHYEVEQVVDSGNVAPNVNTPLSCGGLNGHQHHAADGTIYVPYGFNCGQAFVGVSTDGGLSWTPKRTNLPSLYVDMDVASTPDGTVYLFYKSNDQRVYVARSHDRFDTVEGPFLVSPPDVTGTMFTVMSAGSDGRLAFGYLGNKQNLNNSLEDDMGPDTVWDLYITMTLDAEAPVPTFVTTKANADGDPVQRGSICMSSPNGCRDDDGQPGGNSNRNLLDFIDSAMGPDGRFWVVFTDGCVNRQCLKPGQTDVTTSRDTMVSVARVTFGPSLLADRPAIAS
jgi:hypothetical protein